jgi:hypothetical protein
VRRRIALTVAGLATAASVLPIASASAICELPTGGACPNPCAVAAREYDARRVKLHLPERPWQCWT